MTLRNSNIDHIVKEIVYSFTNLFFCVISIIKKKEKACEALATYSPYVHPQEKKKEKRGLTYLTVLKLPFKKIN